MGFFRRLFGAKKAGAHSSSKEKRRWSFSSRSSSNQTTPSQPQPRSLPQANTGSASYEANLDANKHAIAVAAATAAVAEAALAAAHAAAEVVRLTSTGGRGGGGGGGVAAAPAAAHVRWQHELAALRIQSAFRGYLVSNLISSIYFLFIKIFFSNSAVGLFVSWENAGKKNERKFQNLNSGYCYFFVSQSHLKVLKFELWVLLVICFSFTFSVIWDRTQKERPFFFLMRKKNRTF